MDNTEKLSSRLGAIKAFGFTSKEILKAARILAKEENNSSYSWLPSIRCPEPFRKATEQFARKSGQNLSQYILSAVENENNNMRRKNNAK